MDRGDAALDLDSDAMTENTRAAYPIDQIAEHRRRADAAATRRTIVFLTADAFGVLPPIAQLTAEQAMYYFLSGYTAKVAGTERGVKEPQATFSACFGEPFFRCAPPTYAQDAGRQDPSPRVPASGSINTGWTAGPYGVGHRMAIPHTRAMIRAALAGDDRRRDAHCGPGLRTAMCPRRSPRGARWRPESKRAPPGRTRAHDAQAGKLAGMFREEFQNAARTGLGDVLSRPRPRPAGV